MKGTIALPGLIFFVLFAGCGEEEPFVPPPVPEGNYQRIVSLTPSVTEILFALGAGDRLVGVTSWCNHPAEASRIARVGDFIKPNIEAILSLDPDLVVLAPTGDLLRESYDKLLAIGLRVLVVWNNTIDETLDSIRIISRTILLGREGDLLAGGLERELETEKRKYVGAVPVRVLWIVGSKPLVVVGEGTYQHELLEAAGGKNVAVGLGKWPVLNPEYLLAVDPDVILDSSMDIPASGENPLPMGLWDSLPALKAVKGGRIHFLSSDPLYRPGPRMAGALSLVGRTLHPECGGS